MLMSKRESRARTISERLLPGRTAIITGCALTAFLWSAPAASIPDAALPVDNGWAAH